MRFGLTLPTRAVLFGATSARELLALASIADSDPAFDSIWIGDSLLSKARPDSITTLGTLASVTNRVRLGVGCMSSFVLRDPVVFAYQWASLDLLCAGRTQLAVCTGWLPGRIKPVLGVADRERAARMEEGIQICRALWDGRPVTFEGTYYQFKDIELGLKPLQSPCPIWIASNPLPIEQNPFWRRSLERVVEFGDGWMSGQYPPQFGANWRELRDVLVRAEMDPETFPNVAYHNINCGPDRLACLAETRQFMDAYYGEGVFSDAMIEGQTAAGSPGDCVAHLRKLVDDGARSITLRITSSRQLEQLDTIRKHVLPQVNA